jgi:thiaminase
MNGRFTSELWQGIGDIYRGILVHPFLTGLTDGSLPHGTFAFYVVQDALYLRQYAQALAAVASRAPDAAGTEMFARHAADAASSTSTGAQEAATEQPFGRGTDGQQGVCMRAYGDTAAPLEALPVFRDHRR